MHDADFQSKLTDLLSQLETVPGPAREQIEKLANETRDRHVRMRKTVGELQDSLDYLRLSIKYLVFDLEATRRENQYLRKLLDAKSGHAEHDGRDERGMEDGGGERQGGGGGGGSGRGDGQSEFGEDEPMPGCE